MICSWLSFLGSGQDCEYLFLWFIYSTYHNRSRLSHLVWILNSAISLSYFLLAVIESVILIIWGQQDQLQHNNRLYYTYTSLWGESSATFPDKISGAVHLIGMQPCKYNQQERSLLAKDFKGAVSRMAHLKNLTQILKFVVHNSS